MRHGLTAPIADADRHRRASGPWRRWLHLPQMETRPTTLCSLGRSASPQECLALTISPGITQGVPNASFSHQGRSSGLL